MVLIGTDDPWTEFYPAPGQARAVQIDVDPSALGNRYPVEVGLVGDAAESITALLPHLMERAETDWRAEVEAAPAACARDLARLTGGTVLLKGAPTLIAVPASADAPASDSARAAPRLLSVEAGPGWLATAGSGDVLAGILGTVLAAARVEAERGWSAVDAVDAMDAVDAPARAALAVRLHAVAAELASGAGARPPGHPLAALDLTDHLPRACAAVGGWAA